MSINHYTSYNQVWTKFLQTITKNSNIEVIGMQEDTLRIRFSSCLNINESFLSPDNIKSNVVHSYSTKIDHSYKNYDGFTVLAQIISAGFLEDFRLELNKHCVDNTRFKTMTCNYSANNNYQHSKTLTSIYNLQSLFSTQEEITSILLGNSPLIKEEDFTGNITPYGKKIIDVTIDNYQTQFEFNYGLAINSAEEVRFKAPEMVPTDLEEIYTVSKTHLLSYLQEIIPSGIIYAPAEDGKLQPILFQSMKADKSNIFQNTQFSVALDLSLSMVNSLLTIKEGLIKIVYEIYTNVDNWSLTIIPFSSDVWEKRIFSSDSQSLNSFVEYIGSLEPIGYTALHKAMMQSYSEAIKTASPETNQIIFTITDGENNIYPFSPSEVITLAQELRGVSQQSSMYNIGLSSYSQKFFHILSTSAAGKTIHLDMPNQLEELAKEIKTMAHCKVLYSFSSNEYATCAAGDVYIPAFTVDNSTTVSVAGEIYSIGTE